MLEVAVKNGIRPGTYYSRLRLGWDKHKASTYPVQKVGRNYQYNGEYAIYRKGELVVIGTRKECAEFLGVAESYIGWMTTPSVIAKRNESLNPDMRISAVKLDDDEEDDDDGF